ncbi:hypothetical protein SAMN04488003_1257 [Loktanella fryxellensis]|uniref:Long-chain fatty acid transport protein n=1 Tax=Loktanella fryxellensis TaxID=245187 RepID=A0A1H8ICZ2_9RHOB|nr:hypothetical protein [Loktanella fryxellensis]SEN65996.1 hypothetical protein SAMN04488003_1257 [Loktanella fryxellensis]
MTTKLTLAAGLMLSTTAAYAGGIDRNLTNYGTLFEKGNYAELSYSSVMPDVSGAYAGTTAAFGASTGNMSLDFNTLSGALKYDLTPRLALGLYFNQPFGADAEYPDGAYRGLAAEWDSNGQTIMMKYAVTPNISVYGGVRSIESQANILIPNQLIAQPIAEAQADGAQQLGAGAARANAAFEAARDAAVEAFTGGDAVRGAALQAQAQAFGAQAIDLRDRALALEAQARATAATISPATNATTGPFTYRANTDKDRQESYVIGAAYERPEIALRVALTYEEGYTHEFDASETITATGLDLDSTLEIEMPDVITLDFQTGIAPGTLVFGSIRHATWSDWQVAPDGYVALTGERVTGIDSDVTTYRIGMGRQFNDQFSGFARITYEDPNGDVASRLAPTDGSRAFGFGGTYTRDAVKITGGIEYIQFGEATDGSGTVFADNDAIGLGLSVGYRF